MALTDNAAINKLEKHMLLLKEEYTKLQRSYADLEKKYYNSIAAQGGVDVSTERSSFVSRLTITVASLYGRSIYSDITIKIRNTTMPAHKFVLHARSDVWNESILIDIDVLDWSDLDEDISIALLGWIYTDVVDLQNDKLSLGLLKAAYRFKLPGLLGICERALISIVCVRSCVRFYCVAEEVSAGSLLEYCSGLISTHWEDLTAQDFEHMSGPLLYKMLKNKTSYTLHAAVRLLREDVVFLCLVENDTEVGDVVNRLSEHGRLPLQLALDAKNIPIAQTLVKSGNANINAYDSMGSTIFIDAVKSGNYFAANFLLELNCQLDLASRPSGDTALHVICAYNPNTTDSEIFQHFIEVANKILTNNPNVNLQNSKGETPLHIAIEHRNIVMVDLLLADSKTDINIRTNSEKCALELCLLQHTEGLPIYLELAAKLIKLGAYTNSIKSATHDSLLQVLLQQHLEESALFLVDHVNLNHVNKRGFTALHVAIVNNFSKVVSKLLGAGALPNIRLISSNLKSALHLAVEVNGPDIIIEFVNFRNAIKKLNCNEKQEVPDFNCKDKNGDTPLSFAIALKRTELVPLLISGGADVNVRNANDRTLLHQAILNKDSSTAVFLLQQGADMYALTGDQESPLQLAILHQLPQVVDALCSQGVSLIFVGTKGDSPLWLALENDFEDVAQVLVKHGVDTDFWSSGPEGCQQTLLHRAIDENKETAAIFLIRNQCDLDSPRKRGLNGSGGDEAKDKASPLHLCCLWGLIKVLQTLIDHGANINSLDAYNKSPLHYAIENQHEEIISILLCHPNIDLKIRDKKGNTPFAAALTLRNHKAAKRIIDRLPNAAEQMDHRGRNFLHLAILKDDLESVLFLLAIQVDVNSRIHDANQSSPLHLAATSFNEMITRNLILAGARINERDAIQKTPLHISAERGNISALSALIQNGADYDAIDSDGNNCLHIAVRGGHLSIVRELLTESNINAEAINLKGRNPLHELCRTGEDNTAAAICELFIECMPKYPLNISDLDGNTSLLLAFMRGQVQLCKVLVKNGACLGTENHDGASIFSYKLATNQLLHKLLDQLPQESPWSESDICQECGTKFSLTMRKHHCRHCGRVLCSKCSNNDVPILKFGINKPVRVCRVCFDVLHGGINILQ